MDALNDTGLLYGASPTDSVFDDSLYVFILISGVGFVSGLEIEDFTVSACECATAAENLAAVEPTDENNIVRIRNIKRFPVHFFVFKQKTILHALCDGMIRFYRPNAFTGILNFSLVFFSDSLSTPLLILTI